MSDINEKRTNITILDRKIWEWIKERKNPEFSKTVSDVIFQKLNRYNQRNIDLILLLENLEKYFEYTYFDLEELSYTLHTPKKQILKQLEQIGLKIPLYGSGKKEDKENAIDKIHSLMISNGILPRELRNLYALRDQFLENKQRDKYETLKILYSNKNERFSEVYNYTIKIIDALNEKHAIDEFVRISESIDDKKFEFYQNPDFIYFKLGIKYTLSDIKEDLISDMVESIQTTNNLCLYGILLDFSIYMLVRRNFSQITEYITRDFFYFRD